MKIETGKVYEVAKGWGKDFQIVGTKVVVEEILSVNCYRVKRVDNEKKGTCTIENLREVGLLPGTKVKIVKDILGLERYKGKVLTINSSNETFARADVQLTPNHLFTLVVNPFYLENGYVEVVKEEWSDWKWDGKRCIEYRVKGNCVQASNGKNRVQAKCMPCDTFNLEKGLDICTARLDIKYGEKELKKRKHELEMLCK